MIDSISLFTTFFLSSTEQRQKEIFLCLIKNSENKFIKNIFLLLDGKDDSNVKEYIDRNLSDTRKITYVHINRIPRYGDWIQYSKHFANQLGEVSVFTNADIYMDETISLIKDYLNEPESIVCLSRHEINEKDEITPHSNPHWSQDLWAVSKENILNLTNEYFIDELNIVSTGVYRCDNKLAYLFAMRGWVIYNPFPQIKTYHVQNCAERSYGKIDTNLVGALCFPSPTEDPSKPSELDISVMPVKVGNTTKCAINRYLQRNLYPELELSTELRNFIPCYSWPSKAIPFREYFSSDKLKIFIIENLIHNFEWLKTYKDKITNKHFFFVLLGWNHSEFLWKQTSQIFDILKLNRENFFFMCNSKQELEFMKKFNLKGDLLNQNAWLDENLYLVQTTDKLYNAIYIARQTKFKRHYLAGKAANLALIAGGIRHGNKDEIELPSHIYNNEHPLEREQVIEKINQSHVGLCLSKEEGASFCSSEYLLCGIPVVSTASEGGRDFWYDSYNSIICNDTEEDVAKAVEFFLNNKRDPEIIRSNHISLAKQQRAKFVKILQQIFFKHSIDINASVYYKENFINKMRNSCSPDFEKLFI